MNLDEAVGAYRICARAEGLSSKTVEWVTSSVRYLSEFLGEGQDVESVSVQDYRRFILVLQGRARWNNHPWNRPEGKLSPQTVETYARGVKAFFSYLKKEGFLTGNPLEKAKIPKVPKPVIQILSEGEIERLLKVPDRRSSIGFRNYVIMLTLVDTAARLSEIAGVREDDVRLEEGYLRVMGKGRKERFIPIGQKVTKGLLLYRTKHRPEGLATDQFFLTGDGRPLEAERIRKIVTRCGRKAGVKVWPHLLRHTSATMYLRHGGDPFTLQRKLGHSSLAMTRRYSHLADSDLRAAHLRSSPADRLSTRL
jgi:site-specific recombinase XerD